MRATRTLLNMLVITNPAIDPQAGLNPGYIGGAPTLQSYLQGIVAVVIGIGGIVSFFMLLWGSYEYMTAGGDKEATQRATKRITQSLVGLALLLSSFAIIYVVEILFGVNVLEFPLPVL